MSVELIQIASVDLKNVVQICDFLRGTFCAPRCRKGDKNQGDEYGRYVARNTDTLRMSATQIFD